MGYKFNRSSTGDFGPRGPAVIKVREKQGLMRVEFRDEKLGKHTLKLSKQPEKLFEGRWNVQLNSDKTEVFSFHPFSGSYQGKVLKFASKEGEPPQFWESKGQYPDWMFTVILVITSPEKFAGIEVPYFPRHRFTEEQADDGKSYIGIGKGKHGDNLLKFLRLCDVEKQGPMPYKANPLPMIEKRILHNDKEFGFTIEGGYVSGLFPLSNSDSLEWDGE
jgi:hypothetical protein